MSEPHNKYTSQVYDELDVSSEVRHVSHLPSLKLNKIITINGVFANQAETWLTLATNLGFMVFRRSLGGWELLKECNSSRFEVS